MFKEVWRGPASKYEKRKIGQEDGREKEGDEGNLATDSWPWNRGTAGNGLNDRKREISRGRSDALC